MMLLTQTQRAPHIYTMNASKKLEITSSSSAFFPVHSINSIGAEWTKLIGSELRFRAI